MSHYERTSDEKWMLNRWFLVPIVGPVTCEDGSIITQPLSHFTKDQFPFLCSQLGLDCPSKVSGEKMEQLMYIVVEVLARGDHPHIEVIWPLVDTMDGIAVVDMMEYRGLPTPFRGPIKRVQGMRHKLILHCLVRMQELFELEMDTRAGQMKRGLTHHVCCMDEIVILISVSRRERLPLHSL